MAASRQMDLAACRHVLVVKPSSLGDIVHTLPAVHALKQAFPGASFHWVVNSAWASLLADNPDIASAPEFPRQAFRRLTAPLTFLQWCRQTRAALPARPDAALDFQGLLRSALIARGLGARSIAGLSDAREGAGRFYRTVVEVDEASHAVDRYLALAAHLGAGRSEVFHLPAGEPVHSATSGDLGRAVVVHPWSRGQGKSLTPALLDRLAAALAPRPVVIVGMHHQMPPLQGDNVIDLTNRTSLHQLIWVLRHAGAVVSVDSGPMHLASALDVPLLGLHSWSDPRRVGPWRKDAWVWKADRLVRVTELAEIPHPEVCFYNWPFELAEEIAAWVDTALPAGKA